MQTIPIFAGSVYDIPLKDIDGKDTSLKPYQGKVLLVVNVASRCGQRHSASMPTISPLRSEITG